MSGLGLSHVFPFQSEPTSPQLEPQLEPQQEPRKEPEQEIGQSPNASRLGTEGLAHVFPWLTPPMGQGGLQVFEPLEIGDLDTTPSDDSYSDEYESQQQQQQQPETRPSEDHDNAASGSPPRSLGHVFPHLSVSTTQAPVDPQMVLETEPSQVSDVSVDELEAVFVTPEPISEPLPSIEDVLSSASTSPISLDGRFPPSESLEDPQSPVASRARRSERSPAPSPERHPHTSSSSRPVTPQHKWGTEKGASKAAPIPISHVGNRYLLYNTDDISYIRRQHHITGVLIGTLPSHPQQNIFLGTPLELMPEEARLLVEKDAAYIVDDAAAHSASLLGGGLGAAERKAFLRAMKKQGVDAMKANQKKSDTLKEQALKKNADKIAQARAAKQKAREQQKQQQSDTASAHDSLFDSGAPAPPPSSHAGTPTTIEERWYITPTTSHPPLLPTPPPSPPNTTAVATTSRSNLPPVPASYPLFAHLHSRGYYLSPGLRFGCQYCAYPGDPLRFHSHFLAVGMGWNEEFDLMRLVGGGRLGTGVKKGFLIGGKVEGDDGEGENEGEVRAFSIEWSGM
ncbi:uncharacterized protein K452DRAFT_317175 [Aplosporella prunicola CBS 121167]|uniref:tRNA-intron lyase n=1 Tax=Aplosporella prunicola CBS 121167 TaxID=1176127 RepID=A0A6A6BK65_9PEZI|nr:uncharacterized protein K452DRAFT_317175 [Aplosporella prunicola CBS 121167]KAF2143725.1 hypothetical protein K452DRAFT_317175 [Aplosporella prunicola CBS 121167]